MAQQPINTGNSADDGQGDTLRAACQKTNANVAELYALTGAIQTTANAAIVLANAAEPAVNKSNDPDLAEDSATKFPTQQAVRAYVLANAGGGDPAPIIENGTDTLVIDMSVKNTYIITLTQDLLISTINVTAGKRATLILVSNGAFNLTYNDDWRYIVGTEPTQTFSGMTLKWELTAFGGTDKIIAEYGEHTEQN